MEERKVASLFSLGSPMDGHLFGIEIVVQFKENEVSKRRSKRDLNILGP